MAGDRPHNLDLSFYSDAYDLSATMKKRLETKLDI